MKVALIHDHLAQDGGAEKVLQVLAEMFPQAVIYTLLSDKKNVLRYYANRQIETSIIQKLPGGVKHYKWYLPFMPMAVEFFDLREYDLVISDTSSFAKGVITLPETPHLCYCHTPTRYLWSDTHQYINELRYHKLLKKVISLLLNRIRIWDRLAADRVDSFMANSQTVQKRISKYYRRDSEIIYPPVEVNKFRIAKQLGDYYLAGCRLAPYKRIDLLIQAFREMPDRRLKIFGDGVDMKRLEKIRAGAPNIEFLGRVGEKEKVELYAHCLAFLNPQEEDFGITPIEAMASGRPGIAYSKGGATETIQAGKTGLFFQEQTTEAVQAAIREFESLKNQFNPHYIKEHAQQFSVERFKTEINNFITNHTK